MQRPEIRKINLTQFKRHMGEELRFVWHDNGHLWLHFRGIPRAVIIPMRDEELLNEIQGRDYRDILHKANIRHARMIRSAWREKMYRSEMVLDDDVEIPPFHMTDEEWAENKRYWFRKNGPFTGKRPKWE